MEWLALTFPLAAAGMMGGLWLMWIIGRSIQIVPEYERAVVFRLGRATDPRGPGLILLVPVMERAVRISMRTVVLDVPKQDVITKDNVSVAVNAVVYFQVMDPLKAVLAVQDFSYATAQLAQTTLRSIVGEFEMDELLSERERINDRLTRILDHETDPWGIKVTKVDLKDIDLPPEMKRAMARQAEAERERRAKIIAAEGELQASEKLGQAAKVMEASPITIQLRYLQTLSEIATENNSTTLFPVPIDFLSHFMKAQASNVPAALPIRPSPMEP